MKKIISILLIGLFAFSCNTNEKRLEVVNADFSDYVSPGEFYQNSGKDDSPPAQRIHPP